MTTGLLKWMETKGFETLDEAVGLAVPRIKPWGELDLNYKVIADINEATCIHCGICYACCEDGCYQAIHWEKLPRKDYIDRFGADPRKLRGEAAPNMNLDEGGAAIDVFTINKDACVGCNMCALACPIEGCITMKEIPSGNDSMNWKQYQSLVSEGKMKPIPPKQAAK
jgi:dihydropyrimidine dehydrogenase (NAD+) subunit PreA